MLVKIICALYHYCLSIGCPTIVHYMSIPQFLCASAVNSSRFQYLVITDKAAINTPAYFLGAQCTNFESGLLTHKG